MPFSATTLSPAEMLIDLGVDRATALSLSERYDSERIQQAIDHFTLVSEVRPVQPGWIVHCLQRDWLPHPMFFRDVPPDRDSRERRCNLLLAGKHGYVNAVEKCARALSRLQWEWLTARVAQSEQDDWYKRLMFRNPTRSNWILCEKVYALWKRGYLNTEDYRDYLAVRTGNRASHR